VSMRIAVTGMGAVTPIGVSVDTYWRNLLDGVCGIRPITRFSTERLAFTQAGEITDFELPSALEGKGPLDRATALLLPAANEALRDARLDSDAVGIALGTNFGGVDRGEQLLRATLDGEAEAEGLRAQRFQSAADRLADQFKLRGPRAVLSLSCSSGAAAIGQAASWIRAGRADVVLAGGYDALSTFCWAGLSALRTMAKDAVRPFDLNRSGTIFSEGSGVLVLESEAHAEARGRRPYAWVDGAALNNNAHHMTAPSKDSRGTIQVATNALQDAGLSPDLIDHVNVHGTGTKYNDVSEAHALKAVFGDAASSIPVTANKAALGHTMGAAGALEAIAAIQSLRTGTIPHTLHHETPDPDCAVDLVVGAPRTVSLAHVLSLSAGIGGTNAALVLSHAETRT